MVDVSAKTQTTRVAIASGVLRMQPATLERIRAGKIAKGDVQSSRRSRKFRIYSYTTLNWFEQRQNW
jgi:hypothetical protein